MDPTLPYHQLFRGPDRRWWRALVGAVVLVGLTLLIALALFLAAGLALLIAFGDRLTAIPFDGDLTGLLAGTLAPWTLLATNLTLATFIPAALLANLIAQRCGFGYSLGVTGRLRWGLLGRMLLWLAPLYLAAGAVEAFLPKAARDAMPPATVVLTVLVVLTTTPLQSAAEEILFRGWLVQNVGSWFANRWLGLAATTLVSAVAFAAAHGSVDPATVIPLAAMAIVACWVTYRTGGLEGAIAIHVSNNVIGMVVSLELGTFSQGFISDDTVTPWLSSLLWVALTLTAGAVALKAAGKRVFALG
ncbi:MAG: CPBP family intramembrane metalloprotease [Micropruina sp.]|nr:MAG: CPBP family intramembrane metalloprotease [Micropruina sp.]